MLIPCESTSPTLVLDNKLATYYRSISESASETNGGRLGRHVKHDSRSLDYKFDGSGIATASIRHTRYIPVLDQGDLGSCTGNAATGNLGTGAFYATIPSSLTLDETEAVKLYSAATALDSYQGTYPPTDTGSDGLSVAKAAQKAGLISGYQHITSLADAIAALQLGPIITGVNWYSSFDNPSKTGKVSITKSAYVRGGHEFVLDEVDATNKLIGATNSWGESWGLKGRFYFSFADYERLLAEQGDATVFVKLVTPEPTPTPTPVSVDPDTLAAYQSLKAWAIKNNVQ